MAGFTDVLKDVAEQVGALATGKLAKFKDALVDTPPFVGQSLTRLLPQLGDQSPPTGTDEFARQHLFTSVATVLARLSDLRPLARLAGVID